MKFAGDSADCFIFELQLWEGWAIAVGIIREVGGEAVGRILGWVEII
jgi:hypothetical protein